MYDFYKRQIEDFNRSENELNNLIETLANDETLTNQEYSKLYEIALNKLKR